jgi:2-oxoglutarate dehydrogenase E2 component (dihydrolipoamide succinyltransferase)
VSIIPIKIPQLAESVADATLLDWQKQPGDLVTEGDKLVEVETDKVVLEVVAPQNGQLIEIIKQNGEQVASDEMIAKFETSESAVATTDQASVATSTPAATAPVLASSEAKTSPAVRKMVAEQGIDLASVSHRGVRVTKADILQQTKQPAMESQDSLSSSGVSQSPFQAARPEERVPMTRLRKRAAERLLSAQHEHAILTTFNEINMKPVMDLRNQYKELFEKKHGVKLGFMSFFTKAAVAALQQFPIINASSEGDEIIYHGYYDIGIAVSSPRGLVVPILRNVDTLSFAEIEKGTAELARRARDVRLTLDDLTGGTFSITNGGIFGSMLSTPILNPPQSAILGMHNIVERPIAENGQVVIRPVMYVALSYDHRLIDGREAVQFLVTIKNAIEDPARILLEV